MSSGAKSKRPANTTWKGCSFASNMRSRASAQSECALDTLETLFGSIDTAVLRAELRRLFRWLKDKGMTAVITGERGEKSLTRHGLEEYISDCVILLDHRVKDDVSTRRLRVVKYRGSTHGTNEYPFLIDEDGFSIMPMTSMRLAHAASTERLSSGVDRLDAMLDGKGYFRGSTILSRAPRERARPASRPAWPGPRVSAKSAVCTLPTRNPSSSSLATCGRSASTSSDTSTRARCGWSPHARFNTASRCTSCSSTRWSANTNLRSW